MLGYKLGYEYIINVI